MLLWPNRTRYVKTLQFKGRGYNVIAEVTNFYVATSQISTKFRLSGIWKTALHHNEVKYKMHSSKLLT